MSKITRKTLWTAVGAVFMMGMPSFADNQALIIANEKYSYGAPSADANAILSASNTMSNAGYRVETFKNLGLDKMVNAIRKFNASALKRDRVVYFISGHILNDGEETYLAPIGLRSPKAQDISKTAVPLSLIMNEAAKHPGGAAIFLGNSKARRRVGGRFEYGFNGAPGLRAGLGPIDAPQGVLVVDGLAYNVLEGVNNQLFLERRNTFQAVRNMGSLIRAQGFISRFSTLAVPADEDVGDDDAAFDASFEKSYWRYAKEENTIESYNDFLERYPRGEYRNAATRAIAQLEESGGMSEIEYAEAQLNLTVQQRQNIQRALTILDFDPRGIDGIIGPDTRGAISQWQQATKQEANGYLNQKQVEKLMAQATAKSERILERARQRAKEARREDMDYWRATGKKGGEADLRVYLRKYPDGERSEVARTKLQKIYDKRAREADKQMGNAWKSATGADTAEGYEQFLQAFPNSPLAEAARDRIAQLKVIDERRAMRVEARKKETALNLPQNVRQEIERRLEVRELSPGPVDGEFDREARRAIRKFQAGVDLPPTGYIDRRTFSQLMFR